MPYKHKLVEYHATIVLGIKISSSIYKVSVVGEVTVVYNYLGTLDLYEVYVQYDYCIKINW